MLALVSSEGAVFCSLEDSELACDELTAEAELEAELKVDAWLTFSLEADPAGLPEQPAIAKQPKAATAISIWASLKMHFFRDSGVSSVLESSFTSRKLRLSGRCFLALTQKFLFLEMPRNRWLTFGILYKPVTY